MGSRSKHAKGYSRNVQPPSAAAVKPVDSLLDQMVDGREYHSIVSLLPRPEAIGTDFTRAIKEVEKIRERPLLCYMANMVNRPQGLPISIDGQDHLPFCEMVAQVENGCEAVDLLVVTPGGRAESVATFVAALRRRFVDVSAVLPYQAFSAGTLWVLAANEIFMDERAVLGPIDPQVPSKDGIYVPAQCLKALVDQIQGQINEAVAKGLPMPVAWIEVLRNLDPKQLGAAITSSQYVKKIASDWIFEHKFRDWQTHSSTGVSVTCEEKRERADRIATTLSDHQYWLSHGHGIDRDTLRDKSALGLKIENLEDSLDFARAIRRLWALTTWFFEKSPTGKLIVSNNYMWSLHGKIG
ncbi:MAG TPA: hypothetical protein PLR25_04725 [Planctomycetaceae bacterium]|nr:hypothetical protein [Planctomycetaceae bacterium]